MAKCGNCGKALSCSCKKRKAKDGKECCTYCITNYNNSLNKNSTNDPNPKIDGNVTPGIIGVTVRQTYPNG